MDKTYKINGFDVVSWYAGFDCYAVYKDGEKTGNNTCCLSDVARMTETDVETVKEEMWKQR